MKDKKQDSKGSIGIHGFGATSTRPPTTRTHGELRGMEYVVKSSTKTGRFGRMFRWLPRETYSEVDLLELSKSMIQLEFSTFVEPPTTPAGPEIKMNVILPGKQLDTPLGEVEEEDENPRIPAGYTYWGQFIDHDITFDPASSLQKQNDPDALEDFRTPRLDLDSLYGRGPDDQPYLYQNATEGILMVGRQIRLPSTPGGPETFDLLDLDRKKVRRGELPRNIEGRALLGDPSNDENNIICQFHALFINFHNKVLKTLQTARPELDNHQRFTETQRIVRWHYQYAIMNDYLPTVVGDKTWERVYWGGVKNHKDKHPHPSLEFYKPYGDAYMPVEFSVAAFRFGHSQVCPSYALRRGNENAIVGGGDKNHPFANDTRFHRVPIFSDRNDNRFSNLHGFGPLFPFWEIDWSLFFGELKQSKNDKGNWLPNSPQPSYRIDTTLVDPLAMLPERIPVLAFRNLMRGSRFALPSGQSVARAIDEIPLTEKQLWSNDLLGKKFIYRAPLWYYLLKEAEILHEGEHLGPVGGRIVAEVLVGLVYHDHESYLYADSCWTPDKESSRSGFNPKHSLDTMQEIIHWTTDGTMTFLST
jgi:Animal haem peroxidase